MTYIAAAKLRAGSLTIRAAANDEILVYGPIGESVWDDGITPATVQAALKTPGTVVTVRVNSPGGSVFDGIAIYNLLKTSGKAVHVVVDGLAASAASIIAMAGDTIHMGQGSMMMIHPAQVLAYGPASEMLKTADTLTKATASMAGIYAARTGLDLDTINALMEAETWMTADEAVAQGFAHTMDAGEGDEARQIAAAYDLAAVYAKTPEALKTFAEQSDPEPVQPRETPTTARVLLVMKRYEEDRKLNGDVSA